MVYFLRTLRQACGLKIEEDVDHCAVTLPDLSAVALDFDPKQQHDATVPTSIQVNLKVALPASVKWLGRDKNDIIHPQVTVELFEWLAVYRLEARVYANLEARVYANLWSCMPSRCVNRVLQTSQKSLDMEWRQLFVLAIWWWHTKPREQIPMVVMQEICNLLPQVLHHRMIFGVSRRRKMGVCV